MFFMLDDLANVPDKAQIMAHHGIKAFIFENVVSPAGV